MNATNEIENTSKIIRKNRDILLTNGYGVIVFVLWNLIKGVIYIETFIPGVAEEVVVGEKILYVILIAIVTFLETMTGFTVGALAIKAGKKGSRIPIPLIVSCIILGLFAIFFVVSDIIACFLYGTFDLMLFLSTLVDTGYLMFVFALIISCFKLNKLLGNESEVKNEL